MSHVKWSGAVATSALLILWSTVSVEAAQATSTGGNDLQKNQTTMSGQVMQNGAQAGTGAMNIRQGIQNNLQQAGYTDVTVTPSSFFVHAKDKQGHPVAMVIGPDVVFIMPTGRPGLLCMAKTRVIPKRSIMPSRTIASPPPPFSSAGWKISASRPAKLRVSVR